MRPASSFFVKMRPANVTEWMNIFWWKKWTITWFQRCLGEFPLPLPVSFWESWFWTTNRSCFRLQSPCRVESMSEDLLNQKSMRIFYYSYSFIKDIQSLACRHLNGKGIPISFQSIKLLYVCIKENFTISHRLHLLCSKIITIFLKNISNVISSTFTPFYLFCILVWRYLWTTLVNTRRFFLNTYQD